MIFDTWLPWFKKSNEITVIFWFIEYFSNILYVMKSFKLLRYYVKICRIESVLVVGLTILFCSCTTACKVKSIQMLHHQKRMNKRSRSKLFKNFNRVFSHGSHKTLPPFLLISFNSTQNRQIRSQQNKLVVIVPIFSRCPEWGLKIQSLLRVSKIWKM